MSALRNLSVDKVLATARRHLVGHVGRGQRVRDAAPRQRGAPPLAGQSKTQIPRQQLEARAEGHPGAVFGLAG